MGMASEYLQGCALDIFHFLGHLNKIKSYKGVVRCRQSNKQTREAHQVSNVILCTTRGMQSKFPPEKYYKHPKKNVYEEL